MSVIDDYFYRDGEIMGGYPRYVAKPEVMERLERIQLLIRLSDAKMWVEASPWKSGWYYTSNRPFHVSYYRNGRYRTICYSNPENLENGVIRLIEELT